ncbi:DNA-directed RNA polymerase subunit omega [candidate division KSB1 bacterium]|nr:DNA-directed RNA polymerase subunit omega [candidate division KSB1 bacterium]
MTTKFVSLDEVTKKVDNIYEAIIIIAKRARQINDEQKRYIESELVIDSDIDDYSDDDEYEINKENLRDYIQLPKPTRVAVDEFLTGKLNYEYLEKDVQD